MGCTFASLACPGPREPIGYTPMTAEPSAAAPRASASSAPKKWAAADASSAWTKANAKRFVSRGHLFGRYEADIHVDATAAEPYARVAPGVTLPVGSKIAERMMTHDGVPGPIFAMEKEASGWMYVETDARGVLLRRGRLSPCVECHAHVASQDELFGVPLSGR